jgi:hypothetical protein
VVTVAAAVMMNLIWRQRDLQHTAWASSGRQHQELVAPQTRVLLVLAAGQPRCLDSLLQQQLQGEVLLLMAWC